MVSMSRFQLLLFLTERFQPRIISVAMTRMFNDLRSVRSFRVAYSTDEAPVVSFKGRGHGCVF